MIFNALDLSRYIFLCRECVAATHPRGYTQASTELFAKLGASEHQRVISVEVMGRSELRRSLLEAAQDLARS
jgi:hypothetical protein